MNDVLMPKGTALWLIQNTSLTFEQIANFCNMHSLEVQVIADGDNSSSIRPSDPLLEGQLTKEEIARCEKDTSAKLQLREAIAIPKKKRRATPRYVPISKRAEKPDAIIWCIKNHPELSDAQLIRLIGTTKNTIQSLRDGTHRNMAHLESRNPADMGICTFATLNYEVDKAKEAQEKKEAKEKASSEKANAKETSSEKTSAKETSAEKASAKETSAKETSAEQEPEKA